LFRSFRFVLTIRVIHISFVVLLAEPVWELISVKRHGPKTPTCTRARVQCKHTITIHTLDSSANKHHGWPTLGSSYVASLVKTNRPTQNSNDIPSMIEDHLFQCCQSMSLTYVVLDAVFLTSNHCCSSSRSLHKCIKHSREEG